MTNALSAAQLAIYALLTLPSIYILAQHGKLGIPGWLGLVAFCGIRVVAGATSLDHDDPASSTISSIGLAPLLLAALGILHEGRIYRGLKNVKLERILVLGYHIHILAAVALLASGLAGPIPNMPLVNAGVALLELAWLALGVWTGVAFLPGQHDLQSLSHPEGTMILIAVACALVFMGIRIIYTLVALATQAAYLSPISGSLAIRVVLVFLPELISVLIFLAVGWQTRRVCRWATKPYSSA